ncbi:MAG: hypothetical protein ACYC9M_03010 [Desulfobulbaceae bacterium]
MKVVEPADMTLTYTNVPNNTEPEYAAGTTYAVGNTVQISGLHRVYESLVDSNLGNYPPDNPAKWLDLGATNAWKMLDEYANTQTENSGSINIKLAVDRIDHVVLMGVVGSTLELKLWSADGLTLLWSDAVNLAYTNQDIMGIRTWTEYFFAPPARLYNDLYRQVKVLAYTSVLEIIIGYPGNVAKCATVVAGRGVDLGLTLYGVEVGILDFSKKVTDEWGRSFLRQGNYAKRNTLQVQVDNAILDTVVQKLTSLRATGTAWINDNGTGYQCLLVYGFYRDFGVIMEGYTQSLCRLDIEGLI